MSVINKMLRDLDQRQGGHSINTGTTPAVQRGTHSVPVQGNVPATAGGARRLGWVVAALVLVAGVGAAAWWSWPGPAAERPAAALPPVAAAAPTLAASEPMVVVAPLPTEPASAAVASEPAPAASAASVASAGAAVPLTPVADPVPALVAVPRSSRNVSGAAVAAPAPAVSLRMEPMLPTRKALEAVLSGSATPVGKAPASLVPEATSPAQRQQQASTDALAQAQSLWNSGSHAQALDLMQQSMDAAERAVKAGSSAVGNPVLLSLVREWVRMQMAQSRFAAVWEQLTRLEPVLGNAPDLWALRGNTAQRLGYHQDSVNAYRMALQSNPGEQRWLLGAAVSLAALGQTSQAAEMAERARSVGEISREVQAYLRQLGVPLKDK